MELKDQIIQEYLNTGCGYKKLQDKYGVGKGIIRNWVLVHQGIHNLPKTTCQQKHYISPMDREQRKDTEDRQVLLDKIALLEKQLQHQELRADVLDKLIDVAERDLHISIRKKPGTQQSSK